MQLFSRAKKSTRRAVLRARRMHKQNARFGVVTLILFGLIASGTNMAQATTSIDLSVTDAAGNAVTSVNSGAVVNLTAQLPVVDATSRTQEIVQQIDPTKLKLSSISDVIYPSGWELSVCTTSCTTPPTNFTTTLPTTTAGWNAVAAVRAVGLVQGSDGQGGQIAQSSATQTTPLSSSFTSAAQGTGDGWILGFDDRGNVFNIFHHDGKNNVDQGGIDCHTRAGAACAGTWPIMLKDWGLHTADQPYFYVNNLNHHLYFHTSYANPSNTAIRNSGIACIDLSTISAAGLCGGSMATGYEVLGGANPRADWTGKGNLQFAQVGNLLYTIDQQTSKLQCLDMLGDGGFGKACTGSMFSVVPQVGEAFWGGASLRSIGGKVYGSISASGFCFDPATNAACTGWTTNKTFTSNPYRIIDLPDASGNHAAVCYISGYNGANGGYGIATFGTCFNDAGASYTTPAWIANYFGVNQGDWYITYAVNNPETYGTRVYWNKNVRNPWSYYCFDVATNAACANFPITSSPAISGYSSYTLVLDPDNPNCLWTTNDANMIQAYDATTGTSGCSTTPRSVVTFSGAVSAPRMGCDAATSAITSWNNVALSAPATNTYTTVKLTVKDSLGLPITGFTGINPTSTTPGGFPSFNLTALPTVISGQNPSFQFTFAGLTASQTTSIDVSAVGGAPQLCTKPIAQPVCSASSGTGPIPASVSTAILATGTSRDSANLLTNLISSSKTLSIAITAGSCGSTLTGRTTSGAYGATGTAVPGVVVTLKDSAGNPILDANGQEITTTVASNGTYSFGYLYPGSYTVSFSAVPQSAAVGVKTNLSTSPGTITSATGSTGAVITLATGVAGVANALYVMPDASISGRTTSGTYGSTGTAVTGVVVSLKDSSGNPVLDVNGNPVTTTVAADGTYSFPNLYPGSYSVSFGPAPGSTASGVQTIMPGSTSTNGGATSSTTMALTSGVNGVSNALYVTPTVTISGHTGIATGINFSNYTTSPALPGVTVRLMDGSGSPILDSSGNPVTTTTDASGNYAFPLQYPGTYSVGFTAPAGYTPTGVADVYPSGSQYSTGWVSSPAMSLLAGNTATVGATFTSPPTNAQPDTSIGGFNVPQTKTILGNDAAGTGKTLTPSSTRICGALETAPNCTQTTRTVSGVGTYTVDANGLMTFMPALNYVGTPAAIPYSVTDSAGVKVSSTYTPTVKAAPTAVNDTTFGIVDQQQTINLLTNVGTADAATAGQSVTNVELCSSGTTISCTKASSITVPGVGTYSVTSAGAMTFTPVTGYVGTPAPISYVITDSLGSKAVATYTPTIIAAPNAANNVQSSAWDTNQTITPLAGDTAGSALAPLVANTTRLCQVDDLTTTGTNEAETAPACTASTVVIPGEGTYNLNLATGVVTFDPLSTFANTVQTPVRYIIKDSSNQVASALLIPTVTAPTLTPTAETKSLLPGASVAFTDLTVAGLVTSPAGLDASLTCLIDPYNGNVCDNSVTVPNEGTFTLLNGVVTFAAEPGITQGTKTSVTYRVTDLTGHSATSTLTPIIPPPPVAHDDIPAAGAYDTVQTIPTVGNDTPGATSAPIDATSVKLCPIATTVYNATNCTLAPTQQSPLVTADGSYWLDPATGIVTFDPLPTFTGTVTEPVHYIVKDLLGQVTTALIKPSVTAPVLTANLETKSVLPGTSVSFTAVTTAGLVTSPAGLTASATCLVDVANNTCDNSVTIPNEGTFTLLNGVVTFAAEAGITSGTKTSVTYMVTDITGHTVASTLTPIVPPPPAATDNIVSTPWDTNQAINPIDGDTAGAPSAPLVATTVRLCEVDDPATTGTNEAQTAPTCTATSVTVAGQGTYTLNTTTGVVTFDPLPTFAGRATPIAYVVADSLGQKTNALIKVTVTAPPLVANLETKVLLPGTSVAFSAVTTSGLVTSTAGLTASATCLVDVANNTCDNSVTIPNEGTFTLVNGVVTFASLQNITPGTKTSVTYSVTDITGHTVTSTLTPIIPNPPTAAENLSTGGWDANQTISPMAGDSPGSSAYPLVATTVRLCQVDDPATTGTNEAQTAPACTATTVTVAGQGTYNLNTTTGVVTFDPLPSFAGRATPIAYVVEDTLGQKATALIKVTVTPPLAPSASPAIEPVMPSHTVAFPSILTPTATSVALGSGTQLQPTVCFVVGNTCVTSTTTADGSWTINPATGVASFTANANVQEGTLASVTYKITDVTGQTATSTLTPIVPPPPVASPDYSAGEMNKSQLLSLLGNDRPGVGAADLVPSTVAFVCPIAGATCSATSVTIPNEGTYTIQPNGTVKFVPVTDFVGTGSQVPYRVTDDSGQTATSFLQAKVYPPPFPTAITDTGYAAYNQSVTFSPWLNDAPGNLPAGATEPAPNLVISSIRLCAVGEAVPNCTATTVTTDDGTYVLNPATGVVVFTPVDGFIGTATSPVTYQVSNDWTGFTGPGASTAMLIPTIGPPGAPVASPDVRETLPMTPVVLNPVSNDAGGAFPLDPTTLRLCDVNDIAPACVATSVTTNLGTFVVDTATGFVTFTPTAAFNSTTTAFVPYVIADTRGTFTQANITITDPPVPLIAAVGNLVHTGVSGVNAPIGAGILSVIAGFGLFYYSSKRKAKASSNA